ncbi:4890_t:CDS:2 [Dentiscutata erythropus]|uniref:4890_t:CDS:1 n=1 Tax=Dentiscutata erythropus TaxID=1348616 RepID=A0A9N8ZYK8_9GLOM|nr:4890_t:CDS:2 [Dentiscutata erythropus]
MDESKSDFESDARSSEDESDIIKQKENLLPEYLEQMEIYLKDFKIKNFDYSQFSNLSTIGNGATATIYSVTLGNDKYTLKYINNNLCFNDKTFKKFTRELGLLSNIDHVNIVKFFGISKDNILIELEKLSTDSSVKYIINNIINPDVNSDAEELSECSQQIISEEMENYKSISDDLSLINSKFIVQQTMKHESEVLDSCLNSDYSQGSAMQAEKLMKINHTYDLNIELEEQTASILALSNKIEVVSEKSPLEIILLNSKDLNNLGKRISVNFKALTDVSPNSNEVGKRSSSFFRNLTDVSPNSSVFEDLTNSNENVKRIPDDFKVLTNESSNANKIIYTPENGQVLEVNLISEYKIISNVKSQELYVWQLSGSMAGSKIESIKKSLNFIVGELSSKDQLCLITFNTFAKCITPLLFVNDENKRIFHKSIKELMGTGSTDIKSGLELGLDTLIQSKIVNFSSEMILLSDGMDNVEKTGGLFTYIYKFEQIKECFAGCIGGLLSILYSDLKLNLQISKTISNVKIFEILCKYEHSISDDMLSAQIKIHNLYTGEKKDLLFKVKIISTDKGNKRLKKVYFKISREDKDSGKEEKNINSSELIIIEADVNYFDVCKGLRVNCRESPATLKVIYTSQINPSGNSTNLQLIKQNYQYLTTKVISQATYFAEQSDYYNAKMVINNLIEEIKIHYNESPEFYGALIEDLHTIAKQFDNSKTFNEGGRASAFSISLIHSNQRSFTKRTSTESSYQSRSSYRYSSKALSRVSEYSN